VVHWADGIAQRADDFELDAVAGRLERVCDFDLSQLERYLADLDAVDQLIVASPFLVDGTLWCAFRHSEVRRLRTIGLRWVRELLAAQHALRAWTPGGLFGAAGITSIMG